MDVAVRYWAFLSYSHADRRIAERLHRALEGFRIPRRLSGQRGSHAVPARLTPIFRDRDELTASGHIGAAVEAAMEASRALVVLCSRASAQSPWVDAEVATFERLHPERPVLCVLVDGEPLASRDPATAAHECLPPSLRARFGAAAGIADTAPVAVDLRPQGDGWRLAVQKLVAGLAGLPLDQLVQRDAHRRHQRMAWLAAALGVIAIALGTLSVVALRARNEAQHQRVQAEGLIEFMLGDLRGKLEPVGRLDALDAVGVRALAYYNGQDPHSLNADALGRRSRALHMIGELRERRGDPAGALQAFREARDTTAELLAREPGDPQRIFDHAQSVFWVGYYDWQHGDAPAGERAMLEYLALARQLVARDPGNMAWQAELSYAHDNLGVILMDQGRAREAMREFERAQAANERRVAALPADAQAKLDLGQDRSWLSSAQAFALRFDDAARTRRREIALYAALLKDDPRNAVALERLMYARRFLAELEIARGRLDAAGLEAAEASRLADAQRKVEPANADWILAAGKSRVLLARLHAWAQGPQAGLADLASARPLLADLLARDPEAWAWRVELQETQAQVESDLLRAAGRRAEALQVADASLARLQTVVRDPAQRAKGQRWLALAAGRAARLQDEAGARADAQVRWQLVSDALDAHESQLDAEALAWLGRARAAQGATADSARLHERLRQAGYRDPDTFFPSAADLRRHAVRQGG